MWTSTIAETTLATAIPGAVAVLPDAANAGAETVAEAVMAKAAENRIFFIMYSLRSTGQSRRPGKVKDIFATGLADGCDRVWRCLLPTQED